MPYFKVITTAISIIEVDLAKEEDRDVFENAIGEDGELSPEGIAEVINEDLIHPHEDWDVTTDSMTTEVVPLTDVEIQDFLSKQ